MPEKVYIIEWLGEIRLSVPDLISRYHRPEHLLPLCKACENYGKNYACPPAEFDLQEMMQKYSHIRLFAAKLHLEVPVNKSEIEAIFVDAMFQFNKRLFEKEAEMAGSLAAVPGSCWLCSECARIQGVPCRYPEKLRMSLDAFSLEIALMAKELFQLEIQWYNEKQPDYLSMIGGILINSNTAR